MNKILTGLVVGCLGLAFGTGADAGHGSRHGENRRTSGHTGINHTSATHGSRTNSTHHAKEGHRVQGKHEGHKDGKKTGKVTGKPRRFSSELIKKHNGKEKHLAKRTLDRNYHKKFAKRFRFTVNGQRKYGWKYPGRYHRHWKFYCYNRHYRKWLFYDDCTSCYYYYCTRCTCYLPVDYGCQRCLGEPDDETVDPCGETESNGTEEEDDVEEAPDCCNQ